MTKKKVTLHKANEMVRGSDDYSVLAKRALNALYYAVQWNINNGNKDTLKSGYITIEFSYLRKMMGLEKVESYISEIQKALLELQKPIQLNNFRDPRTNEILNWVAFSFISYADWRLKENGKRLARIEFPAIIKWLIANTNEGNFTPINLIPIINKLRTKYSVKLYEYLQSFGAYHYLDLSQKHLMKLFAFNEDNRTYKNYSNLKQLLQRQINEIAKKTDLQDVKLLTSKQLAKDKIYRILINTKSKKKANQVEAKTALDNLIKRF